MSVPSLPYEIKALSLITPMTLKSNFQAYRDLGLDSILYDLIVTV